MKYILKCFQKDESSVEIEIDILKSHNNDRQLSNPSSKISSLAMKKDKFIDNDKFINKRLRQKLASTDWTDATNDTTTNDDNATNDSHQNQRIHRLNTDRRSSISSQALDKAFNRFLSGCSFEDFTDSNSSSLDIMAKPKLIKRTAIRRLSMKQNNDIIDNSDQDKIHNYYDKNVDLKNYDFDKRRKRERRLSLRDEYIRRASVKNKPIGIDTIEQNKDDKNKKMVTHGLNSTIYSYKIDENEKKAFMQRMNERMHAKYTMRLTQSLPVYNVDAINQNYEATFL